MANWQDFIGFRQGLVGLGLNPTLHLTLGGSWDSNSDTATVLATEIVDPGYSAVSLQNASTQLSQDETYGTTTYDQAVFSPSSPSGLNFDRMVLAFDGEVSFWAVPPGSPISTPEGGSFTTNVEWSIGSNGIIVQGAGGISSFTQLDAPFTQPEEGQQVAATVIEGRWAGVGQRVYVEGGGHYQVVSAAQTSLTLLSLQGLGNTPQGEEVPLGAKVSPAGVSGGGGGGGLGTTADLESLANIESPADGDAVLVLKDYSGRQSIFTFKAGAALVPVDTYDQPVISTNIQAFDSGAIDPVLDTIPVPGHSLSNSQQVVLGASTGSFLPIGTDSVTRYYVGVVDPNTISLFSDSGLTQVVDLIVAGSGLCRIIPNRGRWLKENPSESIEVVLDCTIDCPTGGKSIELLAPRGWRWVNVNVAYFITVIGSIEIWLWTVPPDPDVSTAKGNGDLVFIKNIPSTGGGFWVYTDNTKRWLSVFADGGSGYDGVCCLFTGNTLTLISY